MSIVTADSTLKKWLEQLRAVTEIRDSTGKVLGVFTPSGLPSEDELYAKARQLFDPVKTERIFAEEHGKGRPLAAIWEDLKSREPQS